MYALIIKMKKLEDLGVPYINPATGEEMPGVTLITSDTIAIGDARRSMRRRTIGMLLVGGAMTLNSIFPQGVETINNAVERIPVVSTAYDLPGRGIEEVADLAFPGFDTPAPTPDQQYQFELPGTLDPSSNPAVSQQP